MKRRAINYQNLWKRPKLVYRGHEHAFYKKAMDALCLRADLQVSALDYVRELCLGMHELHQWGLGPQHLQHHPVLLQKILSMGKDLMERISTAMDAFYLGVFLELRLVSKWQEQGFFLLLVKMIDQLRQQGKIFSIAMKYKLVALLKKQNLALYELYLGKIAA